VLNDDLVTIAQYGTSIEAQLAKTVLENAGIESYVVDEHAVTMIPGRDIAWGGIKLQTSGTQAEEALTVLGKNAGSLFNPMAPRPISSFWTRLFWIFWRILLIITLFTIPFGFIVEMFRNIKN
jgi:hypothetical protein